MEKQKQKQKPFRPEIQKDFPILKDSSVLQIIKCKGQNHGNFVCFKEGCEKYPFMCNDRQCLCRKDHQNCVKMQTYDFIQKLSKKIVNVNSLQLVQYHTKTIDEFIQGLIANANQMKHLFKEEVSQKIKGLSFSPFQKQVLLKIQQNKVQDMKGQDFFKIYFQHQKGSKLKNKTQQFDQKLQMKEINKKWYQVRVQLTNQMDKIKDTWTLNKKINALYIKNKSQLEFSRIIKTPQQINKIHRFFDIKIKKFELLYRASQNQFKLDKFHKNCDGISNTLTLVQTEFGKKIGGFTPLKWKQNFNSNGQQLSDTSNSTFIFSLSHNQKLKQKDLKVGIINYPRYGPAFGNSKTWELCLSQEARNGQNCYGGLNLNFIHPDYYLVNTKKGHQLFTGNPNSTGKFNAKEWQVWRVVFDQQDQKQKESERDIIRRYGKIPQSIMDL